MIGVLRCHLRRRQFNLGPSAAFVNPLFLARRELGRDIVAASPALSGLILDIGCGTRPYRELFATETYVGLDNDNERTRSLAVADAYYDDGRFPFGNAEFRSVLCNQVLEHVFNPQEFLGELGRVLARGGRLLLTVPFVCDEHEQPFDYARYSSFGLKALLEQHGFRVLQHHKLLANVSVVFQLFNAYLFKITQSRFGLVNRLVTAFVLAPVSLLGLILSALLPDNPDLFLDQLVVAERL